MSHYNARPGLHVTMMSKQEAERWTRFRYNVPPHVNLGWTPYTIIVQSEGALAHTAFITVREFKHWLGNHKVRLIGSGRAMRHGYVVVGGAA